MQKPKSRLDEIWPDEKMWEDINREWDKLLGKQKIPEPQATGVTE